MIQDHKEWGVAEEVTQCMANEFSVTRTQEGLIDIEGTFLHGDS